MDAPENELGGISAVNLNLQSNALNHIQYTYYRYLNKVSSVKPSFFSLNVFILYIQPASQEYFLVYLVFYDDESSMLFLNLFTSRTLKLTLTFDQILSQDHLSDQNSDTFCHCVTYE